MTDSVPRKFVILAVPRTGSNLLCTLLNSHPEILCHHEVFNPDGIFTAVTHRDRDLGLGTVCERDAAPLEFLEKVWATGQGYGCVGFKWTRRQNENVLAAVVQDAGIRKIVLRRRNRIKTYVSDKIAQQTQQWEVYSRDELQWPRPRIVADKEELLEHMAVNERFYRRLEDMLASHRQHGFSLCYEDLLDRAQQRRLLEFLQVQDLDCPLEAVSVKQNPTDLRDVIANYDDFSASIRREGLEEELHDTGI